MNRILMALLVLALALPSTAQSQQTNAPPGNSAIDEYLETVPGPSGNTRPRPPGQRGGGSAGRSGGGGALTPAQRARLERLGPDGRTLAAAVDATSPAPPSNTSKNEISRPKSDGPLGESDGRSPLAEVLGTVTGSDDGNGMGVVLPAILVASLLAAVLLVLLRRRAAS